LGIGVGTVEVRTVVVLQSVSECRVTVYCAAFTGVSLSLLTVVLFIDRHAEDIQLVSAGTLKYVFFYLLCTRYAHFMIKHICVPFSINLPAFPPKTRQLTVKYIIKWGQV
jgi:hypothetical protein